MNVDVVLHFGNQSPWSSANEKGNQSPWSSANEKGIDFLNVWLMRTIRLPDLLTYYL